MKLPIPNRNWGHWKLHQITSKIKLRDGMSIFSEVERRPVLQSSKEVRIALSWQLLSCKVHNSEFRGDLSWIPMLVKKCVSLAYWKAMCYLQMKKLHVKRQWQQWFYRLGKFKNPPFQHIINSMKSVHKSRPSIHSRNQVIGFCSHVRSALCTYGY